MFKVTTTETTDSKGRKVRATITHDGKRRQVTVPWDANRGEGYNHATAAHAVIRKVEPKRVFLTTEPLTASVEAGTGVFTVGE